MRENVGVIGQHDLSCFFCPLFILNYFLHLDVMSSTVVSNIITLRGSTDIVTEFFNYSVNNILYQRGVYPPESFKRVSQYGLSMMITTDEGLLNYLSNILRQLDGKYNNFLHIS